MPPASAFVPILVVLALAVVIVTMTKRTGYHLGTDTIVRCQQGHLFTTTWLPGASFKAIRLGWFRIQRCPVGDHIAIVVPVREDDLSPEERLRAARYRDTWVP